MQCFDFLHEDGIVLVAKCFKSTQLTIRMCTEWRYLTLDDNLKVSYVIDISSILYCNDIETSSD